MLGRGGVLSFEGSPSAALDFFAVETYDDVHAALGAALGMGLLASPAVKSEDQATSFISSTYAVLLALVAAAFAGVAVLGRRGRE